MVVVSLWVLCNFLNVYFCSFSVQSYITMKTDRLEVELLQ